MSDSLIKNAGMRQSGSPSELHNRLVLDAPLVADLAPTGVLRASINLGNPVLAQGTPDAPAGVSVDLAHELGRRAGVPVSLTCFDAARKSFDALVAGSADIAFLAIEPAREAQVAFTAPYVVIEGVFAVAVSSPVIDASQVDRPGVRIGVKDGSAYDLFLTRTLQHAEVVRGSDGVDVFRELGLEVAAGIRQPMARYVADSPDLRLLKPAFMQIRQALATGHDRTDGTVAFLQNTLESLKANGFVTDALARSGQDASVASPA